MTKWDADAWFIPTRYVDIYIKGFPVRKNFPDVPLNISDAYGLDCKPMEKTVNYKKDLEELFETTFFEVDKAVYTLVENNVIHRCVNDGLQTFFTFDALDPGLTDDLYVKLSDKDLRLMNTSGGIEQPEQVYILERVVNQFALRNDNRHSFPIRTEDGTLKMFRMKDSVSVTKEEWVARTNRAINSIDGEGGWTRMINPELNLYFVPVSPDWFTTLGSIMESIKTAQSNPVKCLQRWQIG